VRFPHRRKVKILRDVRAFVRSKDVPPSLESKIMKWLHFDIAVQDNHLAQQATLAHVPQALRARLVDALDASRLAQIPVLANLQHPDAPRFIHAVFEEMAPRTYYPAASIAREGEEADGMYLITQGDARVSTSRAHTQDHVVLSAGGYCGEFSLMALHYPEGQDGDCWDADIDAMSHVAALFISKHAFCLVLDGFPPALAREIATKHEAMSCRRFALHFASQRRLALAASVPERWAYLVRKQQEQKPTRRHHPDRRRPPLQADAAGRVVRGGAGRLSGAAARLLLSAKAALRALLLRHPRLQLRSAVARQAPPRSPRALFRGRAPRRPRSDSAAPRRAAQRRGRPAQPVAPGARGRGVGARCVRGARGAAKLCAGRAAGHRAARCISPRP